MADTPESKVPTAPSATLVIFGATGDLTRRLLMPSLINLTRQDMLADGFAVLGIGIEDGDDEMLRKRIDDFKPEKGGEGAVEKGAAWQTLRAKIGYLKGDFTDDATYEALKQRLGKADTGNVAFYLATPPSFFGPIVEKLADHGLMEEKDDAFRRVAIEKPFGHDLASAKALNAQILGKVSEAQVYRIDHFLGKETVQNIMTARLANMMVEGLWNANYIDSVQITAAETVAIGTRGKFYDATGALRDMVPNHLFQLLAMVAMEPPNSFGEAAVRNEKAKLLDAVRVPTRAEARRDAVRGRYEGYRDADNVADDSRTETFVACKLAIDSWRWAGVPFYLRTGKALAARDTEIVIRFKPIPLALFRDVDADKIPPNTLTIQIQPDEGITMDFVAKRPGPVLDTAPAAMAFRYADTIGLGQRTGYETLLYDVLIGDQSLFQRADMVERGWAIVQPMLDLWAKEGEPDEYPRGSAGPAAADALIARDGRQWHAIG